MKSLIPDILYDPVGHLVVAHIHDPLRCRRDRDHDHHPLQDSKHTVEINLSFSHDPINDPSGQYRQIQRKRDGYRRHNDRRRQIQPILPDIPQHLSQRHFLIFLNPFPCHLSLLLLSGKL